METRLHTGFTISAERYPRHSALSIGAVRLSYSEVDEKARRWACALLRNSRTSPKRVGLLACRSEVSYVGVLASLYAGAAFVPLNPAFPFERTRSVIREGKLDALFIDQGALPVARRVLENFEVPTVLLPFHASADTDLPFSAIGQSEIDKSAPLVESVISDIDSPAYILFTSGSTGHPKGVPVSHRNILHFIATALKRYDVRPEDRLTQTFDQTFDASVFDLFLAWWSGACVCSMQPLEILSPFEFVAQQGITVWNSVPSVIALLQKRGALKPNCLSNLRLSLFGGEALKCSLAQAWQVAAPNSIIDNLYGPTEVAVACAAYRWDPANSPSECCRNVVPIGRVFDGLRHVVVDDSLRPVKAGRSGELCIAGPQVFNGYLNETPRTNGNLCRLPNMGDDSFYRTGDLVRSLNGGDYLFLGRIDHQVKIRGYRIELGEIESVLLKDANVVQAVALAWPIVDGKCTGIVAVVSGVEVDTGKLMSEIKKTLPSYMLPREIYVLESMPLGANGKIDRVKIGNILEDGLMREQPRLEGATHTSHI
ncbi:MAG: amino acid adenylation domain-containing protein [Oligoflexia bacterium]|nr:amino acid adenylation domain-containing protein [Oligoflexia bacterium]